MADSLQTKFAAALLEKVFQTLSKQVHNHDVEHAAIFELLVADKVEVFTRQIGSAAGDGVAWISDGSGEFTLSAAVNLDFDRGTKIVMKLKPDCREFC